MMNSIRNHTRNEALRAANATQLTRIGTVMSFDPNRYTVKVNIQPENVSTGWIPLATQWVGSGWGMAAPPSIGDSVEVHFLQGNSDAAYAALRFFSSNVPPPKAPSGEFWLVHQSGSVIKMHNDGTVEIHTGTNNLNITAANVNVTGNVRVTGDITDNIGTTNESLASMRTKYNIHTHNGVNTGIGTTNVPNPLM